MGNVKFIGVRFGRSSVARPRAQRGARSLVNRSEVHAPRVLGDVPPTTTLKTGNLFILRSERAY